MKYEGPTECSHTIGCVPNRLQIGMAMDEWEEPGAVLWQETGVEGQFGAPIFVPARYAHYVSAEAMQAAMCSEWLSQNLKELVPA